MVFLLGNSQFWLFLPKPCPARAASTVLGRSDRSIFWEVLGGFLPIDTAAVRLSSAGSVGDRAYLPPPADRPLSAIG